MAQDFHAAFGLGADDRTYDAVDGHGVALAAIQALDRQMRHDRNRLEALEREDRELRRRRRDIGRRKSALAMGGARKSPAIDPQSPTWTTPAPPTAPRSPPCAGATAPRSRRW